MFTWLAHDKNELSIQWGDLQRQTDKLEHVERMATRMIRGTDSLFYKCRLKELAMSSPAKLRLSKDITFCTFIVGLTPGREVFQMKGCCLK